jgi:hypothetical protein
MKDDDPVKIGGSYFKIKLKGEKKIAMWLASDEWRISTKAVDEIEARMAVRNAKRKKAEGLL